jgi:uncharacterized protein (DUF2141 family)
MNRFTGILLLLLIFPDYLFCQITLKVEITDIRNNTGKIMLQVLDEKEKVIIQEMSDIKDRSCTFTFSNLSSGKYAIRYYHDENLNQVMETNLVGKPTEGYGFSNNVTDRFGPPPFEKWLFDLNENKIIILKPLY